MTIVGAVLLTNVSCNSWMDLLPDNEQTTDMFWKSKEEVHSVLMSSYVQMRHSLHQFVQWGELRGNGIALGPSVDGNEDKVRMLNILPNNDICKYENLYTAIGSANSVIKYGPPVLDIDATFVTQYSNSLCAEAIFLRSLCYFTLVRTFGSVPLILEPYIDDSQEYAVATSSEDVVLSQIIADLESYKGKCKLGYEAIGGDTWQNVGRATYWAYEALLADIYLWKGEYQKAIDACDAIFTGGRFQLVPTKDWYTIYYPGNSTESIFEMQYSGSLDQRNNLFDWFYNSDNNRYAISSSSITMFEQNGSSDIRGLNGSYVETKNKIWKYAGTGLLNKGGAVREDKQRDAHWIFYRLADIYLIKAEALVMLNNNSDAKTLVDDIRERAGISPVPLPEDQQEGLMMVLNERQTEFLAEGKRWFDILRMAKRDNFKYKEYLVNILLTDVSAKDREAWRYKLSDVNSYYLPIHTREIENGKGVVVQNPYYAGME